MPSLMSPLMYSEFLKMERISNALPVFGDRAEMYDPALSMCLPQCKLGRGYKICLIMLQLVFIVDFHHVFICYIHKMLQMSA
jgi:hypothetical protein